jgi:hypothetical protein
MKLKEDHIRICNEADVELLCKPSVRITAKTIEIRTRYVQDTSCRYTRLLGNSKINVSEISNGKMN